MPQYHERRDTRGGVKDRERREERRERKKWKMEKKEKRFFKKTLSKPELQSEFKDRTAT